MTDVQKMFLQIKLSKEDQDVHQYLWLDMKADVTPTIFKMTRLTFGINFSPLSCNQYSTKSCNRNPKRTFQRLHAEAVENDMYVDDVLTGAENESNALTLQKSLDAMMKAGGF